MAPHLQRKQLLCSGVLALLCAGVVGAVAAAPAAASTISGWGYVWADNPISASYVPSLAYQANSTGAHNSITRTGTGAYTVAFPGLQAVGVNGGTVDVTAYEGGGYCKVNGWASVSTAVDVNVLCFAAGGTPADLLFDATFADPGSTHPAHLTYVWADSPTSASYTPSPFYQFNSGGGTNTITRSSTGTYAVSIPGVGLSAGTVTVSGFGNDNTNCHVSGWSGKPTLIVRVLCTNAAGSPADTYYTMTWVNKATLLGVKGHHYGYVWANQPTATSTYTPDTLYQANSSKALNTVTRTSTGAYVVSMPNIGTPHGDVQVTAYGASADVCNVNSWGPSGTTQEVSVGCYDSSGTLVDDSFTVQYHR